MSLMSTVDEDTVAAALAGDGDALSVVYSVLAPKVLGYLRAHGADDPEGLTTEVFLHVLRRREAIVGGAAGLRTFVFSVAHARFVDDVRRRARRPVETSYEPELDGRHEPSAEHAAVHGAGGAHLQQLLGQLNADQRSVISLRVLGDLSVEQTAQVLGKSTGAVKQLQRRGLLALRSVVDAGEVAW